MTPCLTKTLPGFSVSTTLPPPPPGPGCVSVASIEEGKEGPRTPRTGVPRRVRNPRLSVHPTPYTPLHPLHPEGKGERPLQSRGLLGDPSHRVESGDIGRVCVVRGGSRRLVHPDTDQGASCADTTPPDPRTRSRGSPVRTTLRGEVSQTPGPGRGETRDPTQEGVVTDSRGVGE